MLATKPSIAVLILSLFCSTLTACASENNESGISSAKMDPAKELSTRVAAATYPRVLDTESGRVVIHHPQIESWKDYKTLTGWMAVEVTEKGTSKTWIGSALIKAKTDIDFENRLVVLHDMKVIDKKFPDGVPSENILQMVRDAVSLRPRSVVLDVLLMALPEDFPVPRLTGVDFSFEPPKIFVSQSPAALMLIDGDAVKIPIEGTQLEYVVNTNWDLFFHTEYSRWYVLNGDTWQSSATLANANWDTVKSLPGEFKKIPTNQNWEEVHQAIPPRESATPPPAIIIHDAPAELVLLDGTAQPIAITDTGLRGYFRATRNLRFDQGDAGFIGSRDGS